MKQCFLLMIVAMTWGCTSPSAAKLVQANNANMAKLKVGMAKEQVLTIMGPAQKTEAHETKTGGSMEFLYYRTEIPRLHILAGWEINEPFGPVNDRHWTPICIVDGKVKGWTRRFYDDTIKIRKEIVPKP